MTVRWWKDNILAPVIVGIIVNAITAVLSKISTGNWLEFFFAIPKIFWLLFVVFISLWFALIIIRKQQTKIEIMNRKEDGLKREFKIVEKHYKNGWNSFLIGTEYPYNGVLWKIYRNTANRWNCELFAELPKCPRCKTELEQKANFLGAYVWRCPNNDFKKRNKDNFYTERDRVLAIAHREIEKLNESDQHQ